MEQKSTMPTHNKKLLLLAACEMITLEDLNSFQPIRYFWITVEAKVDSANAQAAPQKTVAMA